MLLIRVLLILLLLISGPLISAEGGHPLQQPGPQVLVTIVAAPLSPSLSTVSIDLPLDTLFSGPPWDRVGSSCWILSDSPYLVPRSYVELGLVFTWTLVDIAGHGLTAGLGTALGIETLRQSVSIPLILKFVYRYDFFEWLALEATGEGFLYGQGGGFRCHLRALNRPFAVGLVIGLGIGYGFLSEWDFNPHGDALQLDVTVGYAWSKTRGAER
jgi:hypothetical protein